MNKKTMIREINLLKSDVRRLERNVQQLVCTHQITKIVKADVGEKFYEDCVVGKAHVSVMSLEEKLRHEKKKLSDDLKHINKRLREIEYGKHK